MRLSEKERGRRWFTDNPDVAASCADFAEAIGLKTNHCTRILFELEAEGSIIVAFADKSKHSNRTVKYYKYSGIEYKPKPKPPQPKKMITIQQKLF